MNEWMNKWISELNGMNWNKMKWNEMEWNEINEWMIEGMSELNE